MFLIIIVTLRQYAREHYPVNCCIDPSNILDESLVGTKSQ